MSDQRGLGPVPRTRLATGLLGMGLAAAVAASPATAQDAEAGRELYEQWCAGCHGETGAGDGESASYMLPRPRDFTGAVYQIRTTASGELPTDDDLRRVIDEGMPGSTMPGWRDRLSPQQRDDIIAYLKTFSRFFDGAEPEMVDFSRSPGVSDDDLAAGRRLFEDELECLRCHGNQGRGEGPSAPTLTDDWGFPIRAADLSKPWRFNGGGTVEDVYRRMLTGLDGTPMPSFADVIEAEIITDEQLWFVAHYVRSLSPEDPPAPRDVIRATIAEGPMPTGPSDPAWDGVEEYFVPLVGQITIAPRWFAPTVSDVTVQAMHDGRQVTMRLTWNDPTASPDPEWEEFFRLVTDAMAAPDGDHLADQGPDQVTIQFPARLETGTELPYFLGGDDRRPVYRLDWSSTDDRVAEGTGRGLLSLEPGSTTLPHAAEFAEGQWRLQVTRPLVPADTTRAPTFPEGETIPIAFGIADGSNGEDATRRAISAWYYIYLDVPTPPRVFIAPLVAVALTAALGMGVVWRVQRQDRRDDRG